MDNEYDYNFEEEGIGLRGCFSLLIVLLLILLLLAGVFWWWKNYFDTSSLNTSKVLVEIDDEVDEDSILIEGDVDVDLECEEDDKCVVELSDSDEKFEFSDAEVAKKDIVEKTSKKDGKGKKRDYSKLSKDLTEEYSNDLYEFKYAEGWRVTKSSAAFKVLTIDKDDAKLEIFKLEDFGGARAFSFDGSESKNDLDMNVPKEVLIKENGDDKYNLWLYYKANDIDGKSALHKIVDSFEVN